MRLENVTMQGGKSASLVAPPVCVCQAAGSPEPTRSPAAATCPVCGGSRSQAVEAVRPARQQRRKLQDFLSAFV